MLESSIFIVPMQFNLPITAIAQHAVLDMITEIVQVQIAFMNEGVAGMERLGRRG